MSTPKTPRKRRPYRKRGFVYSLLEDPKRAEDFLKRAKILEENGELAPPYRRQHAKPRFLADRPSKKKPVDPDKTS